MHCTFTLEPLDINDIVVYLKGERTGSSTVRKCKFVGEVIGFTNQKVKIRRFSPPDTFIQPEEIEDLGTDLVYPEEIVHVIISKRDNNLLYLPNVIGGITFYTKEELIKWVETRQEINEDKGIIGEFEGISITKENVNEIINELKKQYGLNE